MLAWQRLPGRSLRYTCLPRLARLNLLDLGQRIQIGGLGGVVLVLVDGARQVCPLPYEKVQLGDVGWPLRVETTFQQISLIFGENQRLSDLGR